MPPRYAYWTILVDNSPTAFRAADRADLLPTLRQLQHPNRHVVLKWFERGRLWESPEAAREARQRAQPSEKRDRDWRPGGAHKDPKALFQRRARPRGTSRPGVGASERASTPRHIPERPRQTRTPKGRGPRGRR